MPSYNCGSEIDPLIHGGAKIVPYRVNAKALIDMEALRALVSDKTKAIYVTHYFGFPQPLNEIRSFCDDKGIYLVEDCALSLFSCSGERKLGTWGDVSVFSLVKSIGVPDGGLLVINNPCLQGQIWQTRNAPLARVTKATLALLKSAFLRGISRRSLLNSVYVALHDWLLHRKLRGEEALGLSSEFASDIRADMYFNSGLGDRRMFFLSKHALLNTDPKEIVDKRRHNYVQLLTLLRDKQNVTVLHTSLPDGVCPLGLPILVRDRDDLFKRLYWSGIVAAAFWRGFHRSLTWDQFPEACFLKDHLLLLPVHQALDEKDVANIAQAVLAGIADA